MSPNNPLKSAIKSPSNSLFYQVDILATVVLPRRFDSKAEDSVSIVFVGFRVIFAFIFEVHQRAKSLPNTASRMVIATSGHNS